MHIRVVPLLLLEVAPMGYPSVGQSWNIFVYAVDTSSGTLNLRPSFSNSTVVVKLKSGGFRQTYHISIDEKGETTFQYLPGYSDVAFQAFCGELSSQKVIISKHYVSSEVVNNLSTINVFMSIASALTGGLAFRDRKLGKLVKVTFLLVFVLFAIVTFSSLYVKFFKETIWGYPEDVIKGIVTLTLLKYTSYIGVVLLTILGIISWMIEFRSPKKD